MTAARAWLSIGEDGVWGGGDSLTNPTPKQTTPTTYESLAQAKADCLACFKICELCGDKKRQPSSRSGRQMASTGFRIWIELGCTTIKCAVAIANKMPVILNIISLWKQYFFGCRPNVFSDNKVELDICRCDVVRRGSRRLNTRKFQRVIGLRRRSKFRLARRASYDYGNGKSQFNAKGKHTKINTGVWDPCFIVK